MPQDLIKLIAVDMVAAADAAARRTVLAKWRVGAGRLGRAKLIDELLPNVRRELESMLGEEADRCVRQRILMAIGCVQGRLTG